MRAAVVLQCTLVILAAQIAVACQNGEVVNARWTDGTWKRATILEVRNGADGICGQYRLAWHHTYICEDPTITGDDTRVAMSFCLVSRDSIQSCKQELCKWGHAVESEKFKSSVTSADGESESGLHGALLVAVIFLSLACCCICLRFGLQQCSAPHEVDEEEGMDACTPCGSGRSLKSGRSFWNFTPKSQLSKSATFSSMEKPLGWITKARRSAEPSIEDKTIVMQPKRVAAVLPPKNQIVKLQIAEQKYVQPEKGTGGHDPLRPPIMLQTSSSALRHAARSYGGSSVAPPQSICASPQLPSLLIHREGPNKLPPRKKPPLQGVPPQRPIGEPGKTKPSSNKPRSQAPFIV
eukprot:gnl/MRDRNA2_/MRDRNA2_88768_c0_seq1.p1 gnl/MRDRNA2_/MRDRNA2_88768_c0~~gnl/MRDRNA2_/MRDRNA2_88768_c0_seq1.p1  ORF type:complete len:371 (+),score=49.04 gnl/MRDRNA2_/MRDRNA2_88768_c0_seq1:63-1115(+)